MARKKWSKYAIGITSVIAIGGFIGLTQKIDAINYPITDSHSSRLPALNDDGSTDSIEQEFRGERNSPSWSDDERPRKNRHQVSTSTGTRIRSRAS